MTSPLFRTELLSLGTVDHQFLMVDPRFNRTPTATAEILVITIP